MKSDNVYIDLIEYQKQLTTLLIEASEAYYNSGTPIMTDLAFDKKVEKLKEIEKETKVIMSGSPTVNVGATVLNELNVVTHNHKMLSLDKCHSVEEVQKFADGKEILGMLKCDGLTVSIKYVDGKLVSAETRGDGLTGSDITEHIKLFQNVPLSIDKKGTYIIDGEAVIYKKDFEAVNTEGKYANTRNLASGTLNSLDTSIVKERKLNFIAWDIIDGGSYGYMTANLLEAATLGFDIVKFEEVSHVLSIEQAIDDLKGQAMYEGIPIDGIVFKFNNIEYGKSLGETSHHFKNGIAYKFDDEGVETTLKDIEWTMGKTGVLTPTAVFEPVEIDGTIVERASVHNLGIMKFLDLHKGDRVSVIKANMIIPQIEKNLSIVGRQRTDVEYPKTCPICGAETEVVNTVGAVVVICSNDDCRGKLLGKLSHFVSKNAMNIDGLSEATLQKFIDLGWVKSFKDLYTLEILHGAEIEQLEGFGKRSAEKLFKAIDESKNTTLDRFINALSIPNIGRSGAKNISNNFNNDYKEFCLAFFNPKNFVWHIIEDIGETTEESIIDYAVKHKKEVEDLINLMHFRERTFDNKLNGQTFVITGSLNGYKNRDELVSVIEANGGKVTGSVSAKTDYLINNDIESNSSKNKKAKSLNIPIVTEKDFMEMLK